MTRAFSVFSRRAALPLVLLSLALLSPADASAREFKFGQRGLTSGMHGKDVRVLQHYLTRLKLPTRKDGYFGKRTRRNVKRLERRRNWKPDGRVQRSRGSGSRR